MGFDINKIKIKFIIKYPHFKDLVERLEVVIDEKESTAATDGDKLYFNPEYMSKLNDQQQLFVFAHEVLHVALDHIDRSEGKNHYLWNIATDAIINAYLSDDGLEQPDNTVDIENALRYYTEQLYEKLKKQDDEEKKKKDDQSNAKQSDKRGAGREVESPSTSSDNSNKDNENKGDQTSPSNGDNADKDENKDQNQDGNKSSNDEENENKNDKNMVGHDSHSRWEEAAKKHRKEREENNEPDKPKIDEKEEMQKNKDLRKKLGDDYYNFGQDQYDPSTEHGLGSNGTRNNDTNFEDTNSSKIDWRLLLRESVRVDYDWDLTTPEVEYGVVVPSFIQQPKAKTEIVIDSSGSISDTLIKNFLKECMNILNTSEVEVGFFDNDFHGFEYVKTEEDIANVKRKGGGGTDFNAAVSAFTNRAENKIIFTDGYASDPKESCDAIWIVVGYDKHPINPPGGKVIYITGEDYMNLNSSTKSRSR